MKCPNCSKHVNIFSRKLNNFGSLQLCPKCDKPVKSYLNIKWAAILFIPAFIMLQVIKPLFLSAGLSGALATGLVCGLLVLFSMKLKVPNDVDNL